jgi:hypothetical protein
MANSNEFEYYGFAQPLIGMALVSIIIVPIFMMLGWVYWSIGVAAGVIFLGERVGKFRAKKQILEWCYANGLSNPTAQRRGGFVSWGLSFWTYADMIPYLAEDDQGKEVKITTSYEASLFGFAVRTTCKIEE